MPDSKSKSQQKGEAIQKEASEQEETTKLPKALDRVLNKIQLSSSEREAYEAEPLKAVIVIRKAIENATDAELIDLFS